MGLNTVVVILNDALHMIEEDQSWGEEVAKAVRAFHIRKREKKYSCIPAHSKSGRGVYCNAAEVVSLAHADFYQTVVVHGNTGWSITSDPDDGVPEDVIKAIELTLKARRAALKKKASAAKERIAEEMGL